jgi:hypothetical protein
MTLSIKDRSINNNKAPKHFHVKQSKGKYYLAILPTTYRKLDVSSPSDKFSRVKLPDVI